MTHVKHTPGPWAVEFGTTLVWGPAPSHDTRDWGSSLAEVLHDTTRYGRTIDIHEAKANATLIAAAPELHDAGRKLANEVGGLRAFENEIRAVIGNTNWSVLMDRLVGVDNAVAKAEGIL